MTFQTEKASGCSPNVWQRRTILEKVLIVFYVSTGIVAAALLTLYLVLFNGYLDKNVCYTSGCISSAAQVLAAMDQKVEPCNDFFQFACGNYELNTFIPDDKIVVDTFSTLTDHIDIQLRTIIEEEIDPNESRVFALVKKLHRSCMNRTAVEERGLEPFKRMLLKIGAPAIEGNQWNESAWDWIESLHNMNEFGLTTNYILATSVGAHLKNSSVHVVQIDQPEFGLAREFLLNEEEPTLQHYYNFMVDMAVIFGANVTTAPYELLETVNFERALANISVPNEKRRNGEEQFNPFTIAELQEKYPYIDWLKYFEALLPDEMSLTENETIVVASPIYFDQLAEILETTPQRTIANYFMWRSIMVASNFLTDQVRMRKIFYLSSISSGEGQPGQGGTSQWKECTSYTSATLSPAVGALYVRKFFNNDKAKQHAIGIVEDIRSSFTEMLTKIDWMDDVTKKSAIAKADALVTHIAYPNELVNNTKLEQFYKELDIDENEYLFNALAMHKFKVDYMFRELYTPVNKTEWISHATPAMTNAFYSALENSILFPAGILQGNFLSEDRPNYMNYGAIGQIIGHEITHGFDDLGRQFDLNGNLHDWWDPETKLKFLNRTQCIIDQYGNFTEPKLKININGITTQGENIADNGGMKSAYFAYKKWIEHHASEERLPGLQNYSSEQMFWIAAAQTWCSASRDWYKKMTMTVDSHSPSRFRVIGSMKNNPDFARDFRCAAGAPMNPVAKCEIW